MGKIRHDDLCEMVVCEQEIMVSDPFRLTYYINVSVLYLCVCSQCLETLTSRQMDMQLFIADGCKEALLEEKRRFCFLVDKHCMFSYQFASFHDKVQNTPGPPLFTIKQSIMLSLN